ncbi:MAG: hypothetical protein E7379_04050 [Clostridiales bacterium]|nr:hypothetical protein [Clostridiales bacterium]
MERTLKDFSRFEKIHLSFKSNIAEMGNNGQVFKERKSRYVDDGLDLDIVARFYNTQDNVFAIKYYCEKMKNIAFISYEFMYDFKGKGCFCKVVVGEKTRRDNRIVTTYEFSFLDNGKRWDLNLASDEIDLMTNEERNLIFKIEQLKEVAEQYKMLQAAEEMSEIK